MASSAKSASTPPEHSMSRSSRASAVQRSSAPDLETILEREDPHEPHEPETRSETGGTVASLNVLDHTITSFTFYMWAF